MADPQTPTATETPNLVELVGQDGQPVQVLENEYADYVARGYTDPGVSADGPATPDLTFGEGVLARGEALASGATLGLSNLAGDVVAGGVSALTGYDGPRTTAPGLNAPLEEKSDFRLGYEQAALERQRRAEGLGAERYAWEMGGGIAATLATGGAAAAAQAGGRAALATRVLASSPAAIAEQIGTRAAAKVFGQQAVQGAAAVAGEAVATQAIQGVGKLMAQRAVAGAVEGAIGGGLGVGVETGTVMLEDPLAAAQDIAMGIGFGAIAGGALGGAFGMVEGVARQAAARGADLVEQAAKPRNAVPDLVDVTPEQAVQEMAVRPLHAAEVPDPPRSLARRLFDEHVAMTAGEEEVMEAGTRAMRSGLDELEDIRLRMEDEAGIAAKRRLNDDLLRTQLANDVTDVIDPDDFARYSELETGARGSREKATQLSQELEMARESALRAQESERAAREALDALEAGNLPEPKIDVEAEDPYTTWVRVKSADSGAPGMVGTRADAGSIAIDDTDALPGFVTIGTANTKVQRAGLGTRLYATAYDVAASKGKKLASDSIRKEPAEQWWKKQVKAGKAHFDESMNRYVLDARPDLPPRAAPKSKARGPEARPLREGLKNAAREAKEATKRLQSLELTVSDATRMADDADRMFGQAPQPRRMTRLEVEARGMYDGMLQALDAQSKQVAGKDLDELTQLRKQVLAHRDLTYRSLKVGQLETAYNSMDQGLKRSIAEFVDRARSGSAEEFGKGIYDIRRSFLENEAVWGQVGTLQKMANPNWSTAIAAGSDSHYRSLFSATGEQAPSGWGTKRGAKSEGVRSVLGTVGDAGAESMEEGVRNKLRADVVDFTTRAQAWGSPEMQALAQRAASVSKHIEDTMDRAALIRRDATAARRRMSDGVSLATAGAVVAAVTGNAAVGIPLVGARWLLSAVGRYRGERLANLGVGAAKIIRASGNRVAGKAAGWSVRGVGYRVNEAQRKEALREAEEMTNPASPVLAQAAREAETLNAIAPGLGDELLKQKLLEAEYVKKHAPQRPSMATFSPEGRHTAAAARKLDRVIAAVRGPKQAFERIIDGAATDEDLDAMRQLYPVPYQEMVKGIMAEVEKNPRVIKSRSHQRYLARVTGLPLTPGLMRIDEAQARAKKHTLSAEEQGAPQDGGDGKTARAPMNLNPEDMYGSRADSILTK